MFNKFIAALSFACLVVLFSYLFYQSKFTITEDPQVLTKESASFEDSAIVLVAEESSITGRKKDFGKLADSLRFWSIEEDKVKLREGNLLPSEKTDVLFIFNSDDNIFENQSNIVSVDEFPHTSSQNDEEFQLLGANEDGSVFIKLREKVTEIKPNKTYHEFWFEDFLLRNIKIRNEGLYDLDDFILY